MRFSDGSDPNHAEVPDPWRWVKTEAVPTKPQNHVKYKQLENHDPN